MLRTFCKSKLHQGTVTEANLEYTGSVTIDAQLMAEAGLLPYEQVHLVNITNGSRLITYCIEGPSGSGVICANGAAARLVHQGDKVIIIAYVQLDDKEVESFRPKVLLLDENNRIKESLVQQTKLQGLTAEAAHTPS